MNNIKCVFDELKASEELKEKTYKRIISKKKNIYDKKKLFISISLALASLLIFFTVLNKEDIDNEARFKATIDEDAIIYNGYTYIADDSIITIDMLDKELAMDLMLESNYEEESSYKLYTIKGIDDYSKLATLDDGKITLYIRIDK